MKQKQTCEIRESPVHGNGVFALCDIEKERALFETHIRNSDGWWTNLTPNCLYNHSKSKANCISKTDGKVKFLMTRRDIKEGEELLVDYTKDADLEQPREGWKE